MTLPVLFIDRIVRIFPVIVIAGLVVDLLVYVAPEGYVDLLHATTDPENWQTAIEGSTYQRNVEQIPVSVLLLLRGKVLLAIEGRIYVGSGAAQIDAIGQIQILRQVFRSAAGRYQQGDAATDFHQGRDVFVGHYLVGVTVAGLGTHCHQYDGLTWGVGDASHDSPWLSFAVLRLGKALAASERARACLKAWSWDQGRAAVPESSVSLGNDGLDPDLSLPRPFNMSNEMMLKC